MVLLNDRNTMYISSSMMLDVVLPSLSCIIICDSLGARLTIFLLSVVAGDAGTRTKVNSSSGSGTVSSVMVAENVVGKMFHVWEVES